MKLSVHRLVPAAFLSLSFLCACGGGSGPVTPAAVVPAVVVPVVTVPNVLTISAATNASRNGAYTLPVTRFTNNLAAGVAFGFTGLSTDGKLGTEMAVSTANTVRDAFLIFSGANNAVTFFGCSATPATPCNGLTFDAAAQTITFSNVSWKDSGTETFTVNGTIAVPR